MVKILISFLTENHGTNEVPSRAPGLVGVPEPAGVGTCPSLYHCSAGVGTAWASQCRVRLWLTFTFSSLGFSPSPGMSFLLI